VARWEWAAVAARCKVTPVTLAVLETDGGGDDDATMFKRPEIRPRFVSPSSAHFGKNVQRNRPAAVGAARDGGRNQPRTVFE